MTEQRKSFIIYTDKLRQLLDGGYSDRLIVDTLKLLLEYQSGNVEYTANNEMAEMAFNFLFKVDLDVNNEKWEKIRQKRQQAGRLGGLAKSSKCQQMPTNATKPLPEQTELQLVEPQQNATTLPPEKINFEQLMLYWNNSIKNNGSNMPMINVMSDRRKQMVNARLKKHGKQAILTAINNAVKSDFFNDSAFANFDWIFGSDNNFCKTVDGNYNKQNKSTSSAGHQKMSAMGQMIEDFNNGKFTKNDISTDISGQNGNDSVSLSLPYGS